MERFIRKVLVPVDGSQYSLKALEVGLAIAKSANAGLTILEVIEEFGPLPGYCTAPPPGKDWAEWVAEQRLERLLPTLKDTTVRWDRRIEEGDPADVICAVAEEGKYDLILVGSRGRSGLARFLLGSVSDRVVHHAPCSVTVVK